MAEDLSVEDAAKLLGIKEVSVYKAIDRLNVPAVKDVVNGQPDIRIPPNALFVCIQKRKDKAQKKVDHLTKAEELLRSHIDGH